MGMAIVVSNDNAYFSAIAAGSIFKEYIFICNTFKPTIFRIL